jgi:hypothetical protein
MFRKIFTALLLWVLFAAQAAFGQTTDLTGSPSSLSAMRVTVTATRPINTTTYTANDVVGGSPTAVISFANIRPSGGFVYIQGAKLRIDTTAVPSGMSSFRLYFYSGTPPSALADNAAWDLPSGDRSVYLGYIDLGIPVDIGSTLWVQYTGTAEPFKLAAGSGTLYAYLVTTGGFAPAAVSEVYTITLYGLVLQ